MKRHDFRKLCKVISIGIFACALSSEANASVTFQCSGDKDAPTCLIQKGSTADGSSSNVITQQTIDNILAKQKKAKQLTIEFTPDDYTIYPIIIDRVNNLTFKLDDGVTITSIPRNGKNTSNSKKSDPWKDAKHLISFTNCNNLTLIGAKPNSNQLNNNRPKPDTTMPSVIDGHGADWWEAYGKDKHIDRPTLMYFHGVNGLTIEDLEFRNSPRAHLMIRSVTNIKINQILIHSDKDSPNTDGINTGGVQTVNITDSTIYNGDDSIAMNSSSEMPDKDIYINNMDMYYGHGISIGSHVDGNVDGVTAQNVSFHYTHNGLRIKTMCEANCSSDDSYDQVNTTNGKKNQITVANVHYKNITMEGVKNPIIYDFGYGGKWSKVQVNNISYDNVTSTGKSLPSTLLCKSVNGCKDITLNNVKLQEGSKCSDITLTVDGKTVKYNDKAADCLIDKN